MTRSSTFAIQPCLSRGVRPAVASLKLDREARYRELYDVICSGPRDEASAATRELTKAGVDSLPCFIEKLKQSLEDEDSRHISKLIGFVSKVGESREVFIRPLVDAANRMSGKNKQELVSMIGNCSLDELLGCLDKTCTDELRKYASEFLSQTTINDPRTVYKLIECASDDNQYVRHKIALSLGNIKNPTEETFDALKKFLKDNEEYPRHGAIKALGKLSVGSKDAFKILLNALDEGKLDRTSVGLLIENLKPFINNSKVQVAVSKYFKSSDNLTLRKALEALRNAKIISGKVFHDLLLVSTSDPQLSFLVKTLREKPIN